MDTFFWTGGFLSELVTITVWVSGAFSPFPGEQVILLYVVLLQEVPLMRCHRLGGGAHPEPCVGVNYVQVLRRSRGQFCFPSLKQILSGSCAF